MLSLKLGVLSRHYSGGVHTKDSWYKGGTSEVEGTKPTGAWNFAREAAFGVEGVSDSQVKMSRV